MCYNDLPVLLYINWSVGFPVDTERTAARDYGFPVGLENPAGALLRPVWFCGVAGWCGWSAAQAGWPSQVVSCGDCEIFGEPHTHSVGMSNCLVRAM